jgi:hypothetical protein
MRRGLGTRCGGDVSVGPPCCRAGTATRANAGQCQRRRSRQSLRGEVTPQEWPADRHAYLAKPEPDRGQARWGVIATACGRPSRTESASSRSSTQSSQTVRSCPHDVEAVVAAATLGCRGVSHTPTYDQLRGERINADVPASETDPQQVDPPGKHRLRDDAPAVAAVGGFSSGPGADLAEGWSWFTMVDSDQPGKHFLRENTPGAVAVSGCSRRPGADLAADWSWFGRPEPVRAGRATTRSVHPFAETHRRGRTPAADQQTGGGPTAPIGAHTACACSVTSPRAPQPAAHDGRYQPRPENRPAVKR